MTIRNKTSHSFFKITLLSAVSVLFLQSPLAQASSGKVKSGKAAVAAASSSKAVVKKAPTAQKSSSKVRRKAVAARPTSTAKARASASARRGGKVVQVSTAPSLMGRPSIGQTIGLHAVEDPLDLHSAVALVVDARSDEVLFEKNVGAVLPIASISKLMTAMVVLDADLPSHEVLEITEADVDTERFSSSRLRVGSRLTRAEALHAALMASENRAANALGRFYPGGMPAFVEAMNRKAVSLGMIDSHFTEPTGLSSRNVSNAVDLARMVKAASEYPLIRQYSTATGLQVDNGYRTISFHNTNRLVDAPSWDIGVQKTGYISEAGNCLVMQSRIDNRPVIIVLLDSAGRGSRFADAQRIRRWIEGGPVRTLVHPDKLTQHQVSVGS